jgi:hypothetical protein
MKQTLQAPATYSELALEAANGYGQRAKQQKERGTICQRITSCYSGRGNTRRHAIEVRLRGDEVRIFGAGRNLG